MCYSSWGNQTPPILSGCKGVDCHLGLQGEVVLHSVIEKYLSPGQTVKVSDEESSSGLQSVMLDDSYWISYPVFFLKKKEGS
jgi:hypothetical protein